MRIFYTLRLIVLSVVSDVAGLPGKFRSPADPHQAKIAPIGHQSLPATVCLWVETFAKNLPTYFYHIIFMPMRSNSFAIKSSEALGNGIEVYDTCCQIHTLPSDIEILSIPTNASIESIIGVTLSLLNQIPGVKQRADTSKRL